MNNELINKRKNECMHRKERHYEACLIYDTLDKVVGIPQITISSILSTSTISQLSGNSDIILYINIVCSISLAFLTSLNKIFEFGKLKESHKKTSLQYGRLERYIELEMNKTVEPEFEKIYGHIINEYNNIKEQAHVIPNYFPKPKNELIKIEVN